MSILYFSNVAAGGIVEPANFEGQPVVSLKSGNINGCGFRIVGAKIDLNSLKKSFGIDFSFNFYDSGIGIVKGGIRELKLNNKKEVDMGQAIPIKTFWIKAKSQKATNPIGQIISKGINPTNYLLYESDPESIANLFNSISKKDEIMVGYRFSNEDIDRIFNGKVEITDGEITQVENCMQELIKNSEKK